MIPARPPCAWAVQLHKQVEAWKARSASNEKSPKAKTLRRKNYGAQGRLGRRPCSNSGTPATPSLLPIRVIRVTRAGSCWMRLPGRRQITNTTSRFIVSCDSVLRPPQKISELRFPVPLVMRKQTSMTSHDGKS
jgi:hypothetical protein